MHINFCYFAYFRYPENLGEPLSMEALETIRQILRNVPGLTRALMHTPAPTATSHPFPKDEEPPALALQLYAAHLEILEQALGPSGGLQELADPKILPALQGTKCQQQIMLVRRYSPPTSNLTPPSASRCSYLVHYPGHAENFNLWLTHYLEYHPQIMCQFPNIREIEIYTRVDWIGGLPGMRVSFMQRNKQVFDDTEALSASLLSPVIKNMRRDFNAFPNFAGGNIHYPMMTQEVSLSKEA